MTGELLAPQSEEDFRTRTVTVVEHEFVVD